MNPRPAVVAFACFLVACGPRDTASRVAVPASGQAVTIPNVHSGLPFPHMIGSQYHDLSIPCVLEAPVKVVHLNPDGTTTEAQELCRGTRIDVIAETYRRSVEDQLYAGGYYLVQVVGSRQMWEGWVSKNAFPTFRAEAEYPDLASFPNMFAISPDNGYVAFATDLAIRVVSRDRADSVEVPLLDVRKEFSEAFEAEHLGWSSDSTKAWFYTFLDEAEVCVVRVDIPSGKYTALPFPQEYKSYEKEIDYDTGAIIYSDYPFQFDAMSAEQTKQSGKQFHLYRSVLGSQASDVVAVNRGIGFSLRREGKTGVSYYDSASDRRVITSFEP